MNFQITTNFIFRLSRVILIPALLFSLLLAGCKKPLGEDSADHAYVSAPQVALRDRVAAVYNKVGFVNNGDRVRVLDRSQNKRFVKVRTSDGKEGWMEQRYLVGQDIYEGFAKLARESAKYPSQAKAVTRRIVNLHVQPARNADALYQLKENTKLELLQRASTPKSGIRKVAPPDEDKDAKETREEEDEAPSKPVTAAKTGKATVAKTGKKDAATPGEPIEDWWLARDEQNHTGWILGRMLDIEVPLEIAQYAEGQRIVAAFTLTEVPEGPDSTKKIPQYAVLMSEPKDGLLFDFNQIRVFTWNPKKTRYETAFRERMVGKLPLILGKEKFDREGELPTFSVHAIEPDGSSRERKYKMNGVMVRRVAASAEASVPVSHAKKAKK